LLATIVTDGSRIIREFAAMAEAIEPPLVVVIDNALAYAEEVYLDYWAICHYREPPPPEFRRAAHLRVEHFRR
jgi:hypothetical protein